jgi:hypothetical protein
VPAANFFFSVKVEVFDNLTLAIATHLPAFSCLITTVCPAAAGLTLPVNVTVRPERLSASETLKAST